VEVRSLLDEMPEATPGFFERVGLKAGVDISRQTSGVVFANSGMTSRIVVEQPPKKIALGIGHLAVPVLEYVRQAGAEHFMRSAFLFGTAVPFERLLPLIF